MVKTNQHGQLHVLTVLIVDARQKLKVREQALSVHVHVIINKLENIFFKSDFDKLLEN